MTRGKVTKFRWEKELKRVSKLKQRLCDFNDELIDHKTRGG